MAASVLESCIRPVDSQTAQHLPVLTGARMGASINRLAHIGAAGSQVSANMTYDTFATLRPGAGWPVLAQVSDRIGLPIVSVSCLVAFIQPINTWLIEVLCFSVTGLFLKQ